MAERRFKAKLEVEERCRLEAEAAREDILAAEQQRIHDELAGVLERYRRTRSVEVLQEVEKELAG